MTPITNPLAYVLSDTLPDWRDANAYPHPDVANLQTWATQFMVRNSEFRRDSKEFLASLEPLKRAAQNAPPEPTIYGMPVPVFAFCQAANSGIVGLLQKYGAERLPYYRTMGVQTRTYRELFGHPYELLSQLCAELTDLRGGPLPAHLNPLPEPGDSPDREYWVMQRERAQFVICFNLEYPFEPQLAEAAKLLKEQRDRLEQQGEIQPINNRALLQKAERYRTYLQVLDAEAAGAGIREMAQLLFPNRANEYPNYLGDRAVRDALRAAKRLRDDDYRKLTLREK